MYTSLPGYGSKDAYSMTPTRSVGQMSAGLSWQGRYGDESGYIWMGARYYDPNSRTFVSADPMGHGASMSLYDYANGDPVNNIDADGRIASSFASSATPDFSNLGYSIEKASMAYETTYNNWYASNGGWEYTERERVRQDAEQERWSQFSKGEQFARVNIPGVENSWTAIDAYAAGNTDKGAKYTTFAVLDVGLTILSFRSAAPSRSGNSLVVAPEGVTPNYNAINWVRETATSIPEAADFYQAGAPASRFGMAPELSAADELGIVKAKFDGVDAGTGEMVDRKLNLGGSSTNLGLRQAAVAEANGFKVRWEVPDLATQAAAERLILKLGIKNIRVVVVAE